MLCEAHYIQVTLKTPKVFVFIKASWKRAAASWKRAISWLYNQAGCALLLFSMCSVKKKKGKLEVACANVKQEPPA